jgi:hypothetical protein
MLKWSVLLMAMFVYLAAIVSAAAARDRDHDRLPDRWERNHQLSPRKASAKRDPDSDHLRNLRELRLRTHPRRADTDRDGLRDGPEVHRFRTNPRKRDTDGTGSATGASCARERTRASAEAAHSVIARSRRSRWCSRRGRQIWRLSRRPVAPAIQSPGCIWRASRVGAAERSGVTPGYGQAGAYSRRGLRTDIPALLR